MVILSKREYNAIITEREALKERINSIELSNDMIRAKMKEYEARLGILENTREQAVSQSKVIDEWINGSEGK